MNEPEHLLHVIATVAWWGMGVSALSAVVQVALAATVRRTHGYGDWRGGIALSGLGIVGFGSILFLPALFGDDMPGPHVPWQSILVVLVGLVGVAVVAGGVATAGQAIGARRGRNRAKQRKWAAVERRHDTVLDACGAFESDMTQSEPGAER